MRWAVWGATFLLAGVLLATGRPAHHHSDPDDSSTLKVAGLAFQVPDRWTREDTGGPAQVARWQITPTHGMTGDGIEVAVVFFGPGVGGGVQENIQAWAGLLAGPEGKPPATNPQARSVAGHKITQVLLTGTYAQASLQPGIPPTLKPAYSLLGAVVENPTGNIYWRVTGPTAEVAALEPIFTKMLDGMKVQEDKP